MIYLSTYIWCMLGTFIPIFNAETWAVVNGLYQTGDPLLIGLSAALGQCTAYTVFIFAGDWVLGRLPRFKGKLETFDVEKYRRSGYSVLVLAAVVGLPPLVMLSFAARALRYNVAVFLTISFVGRVGRFALLGLAPETFRQLGLVGDKMVTPTLPF